VLGSVFLLTLAFNVVAQTDRVSTAIERLRSEDPENRLNAVKELSRLADARAVDPLISRLNDHNADVRGAAVEALGWFKDARGTEPIIALLNDSDPSVTYRAAEALGSIGDIRAVEPLISALQDKEVSFKRTAVTSLGRLKDPRAFEPLSVLLRGDLQAQAHDALIEMGSVVVEPLCRILLDEDDPLRFYAADLLTKIHDDRAIKSLISVLGVRVNGIGQLASDALVGIGAPAVDELILCLTSENPEVRRMAIRALGAIKDERAFESLHEALKDETLDVRREAFAAVINFQGDQVMQAALTALHDPGLRVEASLFLGMKKDLRSVPYLLETLKGSDPLNAHRAQRMLVLIGQPILHELIILLRDRNPEYSIREENQELELKKQRLELFRCGNEPPPPILNPRRLAAIALGEIGDARAITALTEALTDESPRLRADAATALAKLGAAVVEPL
jgi:HEAT repeat protein